MNSNKSVIDSDTYNSDSDFKSCGGDTTEVSHEEDKPGSSVPLAFSLPLIGHFYILAMKHEIGVPHGKQTCLIHSDDRSSRGQYLLFIYL